MSERQIFEHALELTDPVRREQFLSQACGADQELRGRIDALLATHDEQSRFLETPAAKQIQTPPDTSGEATVHLPAGSTEDLDDGDDSSPPIDLSFLKPSTKPGSIGLLGHYEILKVLGQGAFGIVFKAFDEKLQRHVAIKTMNVQMAATSPPRKRFLREARAAAAIRHDNVTQVYSVEEEPIPYLVMEYIDGITLHDKLNAVGPLDVLEMLHLGKQIALGLAAAHEKGLVHRDIKPGNILLEKGAEQKVKITDFGLARAADDASLTQSGLIAGTPLYMAPEQALGQALDSRTDLFSFGSVLYQMAAGHPPFRAPTTVAVLRRVVDDTQRPLKEIIPEIPDWFAAIVNKLLAKKSDDRYQSAKEVADLLTRCQSELQLAGQVTCVPGAGSVSARSTPNETIVTDRSRIRQNSAEPVVDGRSLTNSATKPNAKKPPLKTVLYALFLAFLVMSPILFGRHLSRLTSSWFFGSIPTLPVVERAAGLRFDGEGDFVQVPVSWDHPQFTIEAFVTPEEAGPHRTVVELTNYGSGTKDERLELFDAVGGKGERLSHANVTGRSGSLSAYGPQTSGVREHRAIVCDGQEIHYYINGVWQGKRNNQPQDNQLWRMRWLTIGCQLGEKNFFKGEIDQLRVSKVARYTDNFPAVSLVESDDATLALYNFEEGTGDLLKDMSGNGHDAKISGATWIHPAKGLQFDGVDDYVEFTGLGWNSNQYTIEAYISQDDGHGNLFQTTGTGGMLHMYLYPQGGGAGINRAQVYANANGPRKGKTRQHLAVVYDGQNLNYFVQGQLAGVKTNVSAAATPMPLDRMTIGSKLQSDPSKPEFFAGRLEKLRVSNKVRYVLPFQPGELKTDDETLALYDFTTGEGEVIKDSCGKSPDGRIVGATWVNPASRAASALGEATAKPVPVLKPLAGIGSLVPRPEFIPGIKNWDIVRTMPAGYCSGVERLPDGRIVTGWSHRPGVHIHGPDLTLQKVFLPQHQLENGTNAIAVAPQRRLVASYDHRPSSIRVWEIDSGKTVYDLPSIGYGSSYVLQFSHSERYLAAMANEALHILDTTSQEKLRWKGVGDSPSSIPRSLVWSPDDSQIWLSTVHKKFAACRVADFELVTDHPLHDIDICFLKLSPDKTRVFAALTSGEVRVYNVADWTIAQKWQLEPAGEVKTAVWSPDQSQIALTAADRVEVWNIVEQRRVQSISNQGGRLAWSADGLRVLAARHHHDMSSWINVADGKTELVRWSGAGSKFFNSASGNVSPYGNLMVVGGERNVATFDPEIGTQQLRHERAIVAWTSFFRDPSQVLASGSSRKHSETLLLQQNLSEKLVSGHSPVLSPDEQHFVVQNGDGKLTIHDTTSRNTLQEFSVPVGEYATVAWSPDGQRIAVRVGNSSAPSALHVWDIAEKKLSSRSDFPQTPTKDLPPTPPIWAGPNRILVPFGGTVFDVNSSDFISSTWPTKGSVVYGIARESKAGRTLVFGNAGLVLFDDTGKQLAGILRPAIGPLTALPDGRRFATSAYFFYDYPARGLDVDTMQDLGCLFPFIGDEGWLTIGPTGHYQGSKGIESEFLYVAEHLDGHQQTYTAEEFAKTFNWRNDPAKATFLQLVETQDVTPASRAASSPSFPATPSSLGGLRSPLADPFAPAFQWSAPVNLGSAINTPTREANPSLTSDELLLVFTRGEELFEARRASRDEPFAPATKLAGPLPSAKFLTCCLSGDGLQLVFSAYPPGGSAQEVMIATRASRDEPFGQPVVLPQPINSAGEDRHPVLSPDGLILALTSARGGQQTGGPLIFTRPTPTAEFNPPPTVDARLQGGWSVIDSFSSDGRGLLKTTMADDVETITWHTRTADSPDWSEGQPLPAPFDAIQFGAPFLSTDGNTIYYHSRSLPDGQGDLDLWMSRRTLKTP